MQRFGTIPCANLDEEKMTDETPNETASYDALTWLRNTDFPEAGITELREQCERLAVSPDTAPDQREFASRLAPNLRGEAGLSLDEMRWLRASMIFGVDLSLRADTAQGSADLN
jgi:hypothetical protein